MGFNIIAEKGSKLNYQEIHRCVFLNDLPFELIPMPGLGINGGDALGICIPIDNANEATWSRLKPVLKDLNYQFGCEIFELYGGEKFQSTNIDSFKKCLLL